MSNPSQIKNHPQFSLIKSTYERYKDQLPKTKILDILLRNYGIDIPYYSFQVWSEQWDADRDLDFSSDDTKEDVGTRTGGGYSSSEFLPGSELFERARVDPVVFAEEVLKISLHEGQKTWLRETIVEGRKKNILVPSNQWGKTTTTAVKHLWLCYFKIGLPAEIRQKATYETLAISPKLRQVRAFYSYVLMMVNGNYWWQEEFEDGRPAQLRTNEDCLIKGFLVKPKEIPMTNQISQTPIQFANGSKINTASTGSDMGASLAGGQFSFISYDECPLSLNLEEELPTRIMSRLIRYGGNLDLIGTPDVDCDSFMFYQRLVDKATKKEDGWFVHFGKLDDNSFILKKNRDQLKEAIRTTNPEKYRQVVFGEFVKGGSMIFKPKVVKNMWIPDWELVKDEGLGGYEIQKPNPFGQYVIGVDWALANDYTIMLVLEYSGDIWTIAYFYRIKGSDKPPQQQYLDLLELKQRYHADVMMDTNGLGGKLIESEFRDEPGVEGFNFGPGRKAGLIGTLKKALYWNNEEGRIKTAFIPELEEELGGYKIDDKKIRQDCVMALALTTYKADQTEQLPSVVDFSF